MGLFNKIRKEKQEKKEQEENAQLQAMLPKIQDDAKRAFEIWNQTYDARKVYEELSGFDETHISPSSISKKVLLKSQYLFALYFNVSVNRLDSDFAKDILNDIPFEIVFFPEMAAFSCPYDLLRFAPDDWAKKYLEVNQEEILKGSTFNNVRRSYTEMVTRRSKWKAEDITPIDLEILTNSDLCGETEISKLIFAKGLFDLNDYRESLRLIRTYTRLFNHDLYLLHESQKNINSSKLKEAFNLPLPSAFDEFKKIVEIIFVDENNNIRNPEQIRYYLVEILNSDFE